MPDKTIKIRDKRTTDIATGKLLTDRNRMHANVSEKYIKDLVSKAKKYGIDPYTTLAINLQETGFNEENTLNPFNLETKKLSRDERADYLQNPFDAGVKYIKTKIDLAKRLGKESEEDILQAFNGYGTIKDAGTMYGIDTSKQPINMKENPIYGKRIVNLRDSVVMQNPDIMKIVEGYKSGGTKLSTLRKRPGGSNAGKYKGVHSFAGPSGGAPKGSYPINTRKRAKAALAYAHNAPNPSGIRSAVHRKYPDLGSKKKCHGGKVKHLQEGGLKPLSLENLTNSFASMNNLPQKNLLSSGLAKNPSSDSLSNSGGGLTGEAISLIKENIKGIFDSFKKEYTDIRENPSDVMKTNDTLNVLGDVFTGKITSLLGSKKRKAARKEAEENWSNTWSSEYADALEGTGYKHGGVTSEKAKEILRDGTANGHKLTDKQKRYFGFIAGGGKPKMAEGGEITGKGTSKSDSITKRVQDGSFIVPAENKTKALELGRQYLGWEGNEHADRNYPGTEVKVSDGEVLFTPEEVGILSYNGIDLDRLAPKAENKIEEGAELAKGTKKPSQQEFVTDWQNRYEGSEADALAAYANEYPDVPQEENTLMSKLADYLPEVAGAIQAGAGIAGTIRAGRMPDINVSAALRQLSAQQRKDMEYGLEPAAKDAMLIQAEKARRDTTNAIVNRGGSTGELMSNLQGILGTTIDKKFGIELSDVAEKMRKKSEYARTQYGIGEQEFNIQQIALQNWKEMQDVNAGLLSAGIANIVGARKLKREMDAIKKIGSSAPQFIINKT